MSRTIVKHEVPLTKAFSLKLPDESFRILSLQVQQGRAQLWVEIEEVPSPGGEYEQWFVNVGTEERVPDEVGEFVGTYQVLGGSWVFHLYELEKAPASIGAPSAIDALDVGNSPGLEVGNTGSSSP
jgi:hypothetical protein